jgi:hypothetical protein
MPSNAPVLIKLAASSASRAAHFLLAYIQQRRLAIR